MGRRQRQPATSMEMTGMVGRGLLGSGRKFAGTLYRPQSGFPCGGGAKAHIDVSALSGRYGAD